MINRVLGENIRALREIAGFTQSNLAQFLNVDQSLISEVEKGEGSLSADMLGKLAVLFGVTVEQIENKPIAISKLSFASRGREFSLAEMEAISAINKIALNSEYMRVLLKEVEGRTLQEV